MRKLTLAMKLPTMGDNGQGQHAHLAAII